MAELISSNSTSSALHSSPTRKRTRDSSLAAPTTTAAPTYKATFQPLPRPTSDYLHSTCNNASNALATDDASTFVAMEASSTSAAVPLTQPRISIRNKPITKKTTTTTAATTNGVKNGHTNGGGFVDNRNQYVVSSREEEAKRNKYRIFCLRNQCPQ